MSDPRREFPELDPNATGLHAAWYRANRMVGSLTAQRCDCGVWRHPPRYRCGVCRGDAWEFVALSEPSAGGVAATVESSTVTRRALHAAFSAVVPYAIVVARTDQGLQFFVCHRTDTPDSVGIGDEVRLLVDSFGVPYAR